MKEQTSDRVPLVLTYNDLLPNIHEIVNKRMDILHHCDNMKKVFPDPPIIAYRRDRNLSDIIVHGKLNKVTKNMTKEEPKICEKKCDVCQIMRKDKHIYNIDKTKQFYIKDNNYGCQMENLIYGIHCKTCDRYIYVGETERTLQERIKEHLADISHMRDKTVSHHFNGENHTRNDMTVQVLQQIYEKSSYYRRTIETKWVQRLNTLKPFGANVKGE